MTPDNEFTEEEINALREAEANVCKRLEQAKREQGISETPPARVAHVLTFPRPVVTPEQIQELEQRKQERDAALRAKRAEQMLPPVFRWARFGIPELERRVSNPHAITLAAGLALDDRVVFRGPSGVGKTSLAAAAARRLATLHPHAHVRFESAFALGIARAKHPLGEGDPHIVVEALRSDLLVIDDLGSDDDGQWSVIRELIFERHWNAKTTWVTTWMATAEITKKYGDGIARRMFEGAVVIDCGAP